MAYTDNTIQLPTTASATQQLTYNADYNRGYGDAFLNAYSQAVSRTQIDDSTLWKHRELSIQSIFRSLVLLAFGGFIVLYFILAAIQTLVIAGLGIYTIIAPIVLAIVIGYFIREKRYA